MPGITRNQDPISCGDKAKSLFSAVQTNELNTVRKSDPTEGVSPHTPTTYLLASTNVFIGDTGGSGDLNFGAVRVGDPIIPHGHPGVVSIGSTDVFVNSGSGAGTLIDNNPPAVAVNGVPTNTPPEMQTELIPEFIEQTAVSGAFTYTMYNVSVGDLGAYEQDDEATGSPSSPSGTEIDERKTIPKEEDPTTAPIQPPPVHSCSNVESLSDTFNWITEGPYTDTYEDFKIWSQSFDMSNHFNLYQLTMGTAVSRYKFTGTPTQLSGISQKETLQNLCLLSNTVLDDIMDMFSADKPIITSAFRSKAGASQHNKGQAADIQFLNFHGQSNTAQLYFERAKLIRDTFNFDQLILEWYGRNPWIHISVNPGTYRHQVLTQVGTNSYQPGLTLLG